jgi:Dna[CI] antecedent, DciA
MERLGDDARRVLAAAGAPEAGVMNEIVHAWPAAVGEAVARNAWPARLRRDGTLHVATASSAWAFELSRLGEDVLSRLRETLGDDTPKGLTFAPGPVPEVGPDLAEPPVSVDIDPPRPEERRAAAELTTRISDPELRELVARAAAASLSRARSGRRFW